MASLLESLASQIGQQDISQISRQLGTDENSTQSAIEAALPLLVDALGRNADSDQGAEALTNALRNKHQGSVVDNLSGYFSNGGDVQDGNGILGHVLGNQRSVVERGLSQFAGMDTGNSSRLLAMLAPVVLGQLGQMQQRNNMGANDVQNLLRGERQQAESQLGGMARLLDMDGDGDITDDMMNLGGRLLGGFFGGRR